MGGESQITFDDVLDNTISNDIYAAVSSIGDVLTESERERSGDNCATVSRQQRDDEDFTFCIQLPARTNNISKQAIAEVTESVDFIESSVVIDSEPPYTIWRFCVSFEDIDETVYVVIVKPVEDGEVEADGDKTSFTDSYEQFDFTKFVRGTESE